VWNGKARVTRAVAPGALEVGAPIPEGQRNSRLFKIACALRRHGCTPQEILSAIQVVNRRCVPPLDDAELREIVASAARYRPAG
jgi:putative DNA primase/helicase